MIYVPIMQCAAAILMVKFTTAEGLLTEGFIHDFRDVTLNIIMQYFVSKCKELRSIHANHILTQNYVS